jgi:hypothetical protein
MKTQACPISIGCSRRNARIAAPTGWCVPTQHRMSVAIGEATDQGTRLKARLLDVPELVKVGGNHGATAASRQAHAECIHVGRDCRGGQDQ